MRVWQRLLDALDRNGRVGMATIVGTEGSSPREAGARMVVLPDGSFFGTVGGGTLEWRMIAELQRMLAGEAASPFDLRSIALGPELGQCCGGRIDVALERFDPSRREEVAMLAAAEGEGVFRTRSEARAGAPLRRSIDTAGTIPIGAARRRGGEIEEGFGEDRRTLFLFGAGHVGRALVLALAPLPFDIVWIDPRDGAFPSHVPANCRCVQAADPAAMLSDASEGAFVLVMTHSHALDLAIVHKALALSRFAYVGLIGSNTKRIRFERQLADAGVPAGRIAELTCPIGIPGIRSKLPAVIAASVASDLLIRDEAERAGSSARADQSRVVSVRSPRGS